MHGGNGSIHHLCWLCCENVRHSLHFWKYRVQFQTNEDEAKPLRRISAGRDEGLQQLTDDQDRFECAAREWHEQERSITQNITSTII